MVDSTISQCSCTSGKGGRVYLATKETGDLNFTFVGMKFSSNTAKVGNDIFIECFNISSQINERQFHCEHKEDTNLIEFVTIHQSDTIVVSSAVGSDDRQCGTCGLLCDSIDYRLMHLTSELISQMFIVEEKIDGTKEALITTSGTVSLLRENFVFDSDFISSHESLISPEGGILEIMNCSFSSKPSNEEGNGAVPNIPFHIFNMAKGELQLDGCAISNLILQESALHFSSPLTSVIDSLTICNSTIKTSLININECGQLTIKDFNTENISVVGNEESLISCLSMKKTMQLANCTIGGVSSKNTKGKLMKVEDCLDVKMDSCIFDGSSKERNEQNLNAEEEMCRWSGSLVDVAKSSVFMKDATISNSPEGGITMSGGNVIIEKGEFINNNPSIEGYPSIGRNIICSDSGALNVMSLKGGDGLKDNSSLWMLNEECSFEGIVSERESSFFIPVLERVEAKEEANRMKLTFKGLLLVPCNLSFSAVKKKGEEKEIEHYDFDSIVILFVVLIGFILFVVRWKKAKNENKDLREIVNDNIRKDPKAFEMMTMEMSPEEQWRRSEREAEKKNEERIKKRVHEKSLGHSESSELLLSESSSTEFILGRDSEKIPQWMLEKAEEEEETRKRSPSPSISSTSTTDASDTESTFVRGEDLCPTTSSMSNLVDAMAC
ncbi:uncharacterized protein MONOS_14069 [Monocercomonoides exilis]|uniref:uncharacterized protein n=1 Tax=Monocercomonoides exilis TaxID=2049356 RepID=UPI00355A7280|nr:hypothetical protein MONOS_14069 [Monocercomonoides exilis]|eukprot:MONOS_14069.1-p1 / transcript=MONOS_14069.1 / gene=MONOS_14069 / organism=Monocercomonoides_exilis_PA203 / gene_product=unspecified product / transcript_product=unspecified product / location=Mono_scaffold00931:8849-11227(-) / protein_length=667 / sequence_SO=supercontig / SO=protein_coding / is_pseudo=false